MKRTLLILALALSAMSAHAADMQPKIANCVASPETQFSIPIQKAAEADLEAGFGERYYHEGKMSLAIPAFNRALQLDPCNGRAHYYSWRFNVLGGHIAAARQQLDFAHELAPEDAQIQKTWAAVQAAIQMENEPGAPRVTAIKPPRDRFFAKRLNCGGIPVLSAAIVDADALMLACGKVRTMLQNLPAARRELIANGAEFHIIGEFQGTSDLPENARYRNSTYVDAEGKGTDMNKRTRGVGSLLSSCGEENLLGLPGDRYGDGSDTCIHEFAHDIMEHGLTGEQHSDIEKQYRAVVKQGLWKGAYAAVNAQEYWAELSMWYFGSHGNRIAAALTTAGPEALREYDPGGFALMKRIYGSPMIQ